MIKITCLGCGREDCPTMVSPAYDYHAIVDCLQDQLYTLREAVRELLDAAKEPYYHDTIGSVGRAHLTYPERLTKALAAIEELIKQT